MGHNGLITSFFHVKNTENSRAGVNASCGAAIP